MNHSPEPWKFVVAGRRVLGIHDAAGENVLSADRDGAYLLVSDENMARIAACVNALAGIPTDVVHVFVGRMKHALVMASELGPLRLPTPERLLVAEMEQSVKVLNELGYHWEKKT